METLVEEVSDTPIVVPSVVAAGSDEAIVVPSVVAAGGCSPGSTVARSDSSSTSNGHGETQGQHCGHILLSSAVFEHAIGIAILLNFVVVIAETDRSAKDLDSPQWVVGMSWTLLVIFVLELSLKLFTFRGSFPKDRWNVFDFMIIGVDLVVSIVGLYTDMFSVSGLRVLRLVRLVRATRMIELFPELRLMLAGLVGALNAIVWGTILLVTVLLIWSVIAVQFIHPLNQEVAKTTIEYDQCPRCPHAYESTFQAFLTLCTQIVAGDSWGRETVPVIELYPATALFFFGVFITVGMALLNLMLAVVVNVATEERERMLKDNDLKKKMDRLEAHDKLYEICMGMDEDGSGQLDLDEVKRGFDSSESFRIILERMDIARSDLDFVWTILDSNKSGKVTVETFVTQIYQLKSSDTQYMIAYIRFYLMEIKQDLRCGQQTLKADLQHGQVELQAKLRGGQDDLHKSLSLGQEELQKKLRAGQEELQRKLRAGQEELRKRLAAGQAELSKGLHAGQDRVKRYVHKSMKMTEADWLKEEEETQRESLKRLDSQDTDRRSSVSIDDPKDMTDAVQQLGSLAFSFDEQTLKVRNDANDITITDLPAEQYAERLVELNKVWKQCLDSIEDVTTRQSDLSSLLSTQAQCLVSVIQSVPSSRSPGTATI